MEIIDRKFQINAINPCNGKEYTEKNSLLLCAKDKAVPAALKAYQLECLDLDCASSHIESIGLLIDRVEGYQIEVESRTPDTNGNCEVDRCIGGQLETKRLDEIHRKIKSEVLLSTKQILELCSFAGIEVDRKKSTFSEDEDQLETEYRVAQNDHGAVAWLDEYPEEGCYPLSDNYPAEEGDVVDR